MMKQRGFEIICISYVTPNGWLLERAVQAACLSFQVLVGFQIVLQNFGIEPFQKSWI